MPARRAPSTEGSGSREEHNASPQSQELFQSLRQALRSDEPLDLLATVSSLVNALDPRMRNPFEPAAQTLPTLDELIESFVGVDYAETTAALTVLRSFVADELLAARLGTVLQGRRQPMPAWLTNLEAARVGRVTELTHELGDGDDYLLELLLATGETLTVLVYVDHNMGGIVKDAFVIPDSLDAVQTVVREKIDDPETSVADLDPAVARAEVERAIDWGARTVPQPQTDSWPAARPLVEWVLRKLPTGGQVRPAREWSEEELASLREEFFASPYAEDVDGEDERGLLGNITWYAAGWGSRDPLRWSEVRVEILLTDWIPRKVVADVRYLAKTPALLRRFIAFCHRRVDLRPALTEEVLAAVDRWAPEYQRLIRSPRPQGAEALARRLLESSWYDDVDDVGDADIGRIMLESLDRAVGGRSALLDLDTAPLPDEQFQWAGIPADVHERVREVLALCDRCAEELFDVEHRTAFRRFLARAAAVDPGIFRRKGAANRAAAAVCWAVGRANDSVAYPGGLQARELLEWFGVKGSVSQRAEAFLRANGVDPYLQFGTPALGSPDLLTAATRRELATYRDRYLPAPSSPSSDSESHPEEEAR